MSISLWTRVVAVALLVVASVVGNVSMSASPVDAARGPVAVASLPAASTTPSGEAVAPVASSDDDVQMVPAVFARDPNTQFLFARHVSKWM